MMIGNPNTMVRDRSPLWNNFKDNRYQGAYMVNNFFLFLFKINFNYSNIDFSLIKNYNLIYI